MEMPIIISAAENTKHMYFTLLMVISYKNIILQGNINVERWWKI